MTQEDLAVKMGTRQPAIARIERGDANTKLATLVRLAEALDTTVRIDLVPVELIGEAHPPRWWEAPERARAAVVPLPPASALGAFMTSTTTETTITHRRTMWVAVRSIDFPDGGEVGANRGFDLPVP